jgi:DNA repair exonuclease SbcCD nuclease subunit
VSFLGCAIGDLHLDKLTKYWSNANALQLASVRRVVDSARRKGTDQVFFLGDIAEGIRDNTGNAMRLSEPAQCELLKLLMELDQVIDTHIILGNHDWASEGSHSLNVFIEMQRHGVFKRVRFYPELDKVKIAGKKIAMMPYPNVEPPKGCQLGFAHYEVSGAVGDNGRAVRSQEDFDWECPIIQGHLHTHQRVRNHWYPGTLYQTSFGENQDKGYALLHMGQKLKVQWIQHEPPFKLVNLRVNKREDFKQLVNDELTLFKLFVHENVTVPDDLLTKFPNIVNRLAFATDIEAEALEQDEFQTENQRIDLNDREALPDFLTAKGASRKQVERALQIVDDFRSIK